MSTTVAMTAAVENSSGVLVSGRASRAPARTGRPCSTRYTTPCASSARRGTTTACPRAHDWLAFEVEHAEYFARSRRRRRRHGSAEGAVREDEDEHEAPLEAALRLQGRGWLEDEEKLGENDDDGDDEVLLGYLHTYRATRPLNLLYIDGMAAAKTWYGTLDTQDLLLTHVPGRQPMDDIRRGGALCEASAAAGWGVDGFIRMEPGFEVVFCDFSPASSGGGLELVSAPRQAGPDDPAYADADDELLVFEWARAASQRYRGIGAGRVRLDYSAMVSAYFYPVNLTNPDPGRPDLPRLTQATEAQLAAMRERVAEVAPRRGLEDGVDWQGVTDSKLLDIFLASKKKRNITASYTISCRIYRLIMYDSDHCAIRRPAPLPSRDRLARPPEKGNHTAAEPAHGLLRNRRPRTRGCAEALRATLSAVRQARDPRRPADIRRDREHDDADLRVALRGPGTRSPRPRPPAAGRLPLLESIGRGACSPRRETCGPRAHGGAGLGPVEGVRAVQAARGLFHRHVALRQHRGPLPTKLPERVGRMADAVDLLAHGAALSGPAMWRPPAWPCALRAGRGNSDGRVIGSLYN